MKFVLGGALAGAVVLAGGAQAATLFAADSIFGGVLNAAVELDSSTLATTGGFYTAGRIGGLATDGTNLFVSMSNGVYEYDMTGQLERSYTGLFDHFGALALSGGSLYAADSIFGGAFNGVVQLDAATLTNTQNGFLTSGAIAGLAADGGAIYASLPNGVTEFDQAGVVEHTYQGVFDKFGALAIGGGVVYAADAIFGGAFNAIVELNAADLTNTQGGFLTNGLVSGVATDGTELYVALPGGIYGFTPGGALLGAHPDGLFDAFGPLAVAPAVAPPPPPPPPPPPGVPEPQAWIMMLAGFAALGSTLRRRRLA